MTGPASPRVLIFDSGVGGLTVAAAVRERLPDAGLFYLADRAWFPYGPRAADELIGRVIDLMDNAIARVRPDVVVIACSTASTLVLDRLRARFAVPFVGTVPAIKPAVALTKTGIVGVLATPGTVRRDYTRQLIADFAGGVEMVLHGPERLAGLAEDKAAGRPADLPAVAAAIAPVFVERQGRRTDIVVLGCTHFPLLGDEIEKCAPWPVTFLDPADAIARRVAQVIGDRVAPPAGEVPPGTALLTAIPEPGDGVEATFAAFGFAHIELI